MSRILKNWARRARDVGGLRKTLGVLSLALFYGCSGGGEQLTETPGSVEQAVLAPPSLSLRVSRSSSETGSLVASTSLTLRTMVTSLKQGNGTVKHILWRLNNDDTLERVDSATDSTIAGVRIAVARLDDERFVQAMQTSTGLLQVSVWSAIGGSLRLLGSKVDQAVSDVDVVGMSLAPGRLVTGDPPTWTDADFAVAVKNGDGTLRLIDFIASPAGSISRRDSAVMGSVILDGNIQLAKVPGPNRMLVTSSRLFNGAQAPFWKLHSWKIESNGAVSLLAQSAPAIAGTNIVTPASFRRVATLDDQAVMVNNVRKEMLTARTWDIDSAGQFTEHSHVTVMPATAATVNSVSIVAGGAARLFIAYGQTASGTGVTTGRLIALDAADALRVTQDVLLPDTRWKNSGRVVTLSEANPMLAWLSNLGTVTVDAYRDYNMPLLRGSYLPTGARIPSPIPTGGRIDDAGSSSNDLTIAVGHSYVMACAGAMSFYDKQGIELPIKYTGVASSQVSYGALFSSVIEPSLEQSLSRHLSYQDACDPNQDDSDTNECPRSVFDVRCAYDALSRRFVAMAMVRWRKCGGSPRECTQRHVALAVSKTEDPRDGFMVFLPAENKSTDDNPTLTVTAGSLIVTHRAPGRPYQTEDHDYSLDDEEHRLVPSAYIMNVGDLSANLPNPRITKTLVSQTGGTAALTSIVTGDSKVAVLSETGSHDNLVLHAFFQASIGPVAVANGSVPYKSTVFDLEDTQPTMWSPTVADDANGNAHRVGRIYVASAKGKGGWCDRNVGSGGTPEAASDGDCDARLSSFPFTLDTTPTTYTLAINNSDIDVVVPCPGRTASTHVSCSRVSVGATGLHAVMGFRQLQFDPSNNLVTSPIQHRTVRFNPSTLAFLDAGADHSRLVHAGTKILVPVAGFTQTMGDPADVGVWTLGESTNNCCQLATGVRLP